MRMKKWFSNLGYRIQYFMQGRYGYDELCRFLSVSALVLLLLSYIPYLGFFYIVALTLLVWSCFRSFSKNIYKRQMERQKYLTIKNKIRSRFVLCRNIWRERKTHKYYRCLHCKATVRTGIQKQYSIGRQKTSAILPPQTRLILMVRLSQ